MIWFTSDLHFFHDRILEFHPKRKEIFGSTVEKAKEAIIQLWNSRVNKKDTVYILGDLAFGEVEDKRKLFQRLNGNKVLILGNKVDKINTDSKELRVDVGIDGNLANYDLISLEKLANHFTKIEKDNEHGMVK